MNKVYSWITLINLPEQISIKLFDLDDLKPTQSLVRTEPSLGPDPDRGLPFGTTYS